VTTGARRGSQALDDLEGFLSLQFLDDAPQRAGQPPDIVV
jgi:hypothetical protein